MSISTVALDSHIHNLNAGQINFSQVELNLRADLVRFEGYSLEEASLLTDEEVDAITYGCTQAEYDYEFETKCKCEKCQSFLYEVDYSDFDDCYTLLCKTCKDTLRLHYAAYDGWRDSIVSAEIFEEEASPVVKALEKHCTVHVDNSNEFKEWVRKNAALIQSIELLDETHEYYQMNGRFFYIGWNSGEYVPSSDEAFGLFMNEIGNI